MTLPPESPWHDAVLAAAIFAVDPAGLAGISVKARAGAVRDKWLGTLRGYLRPSAPIRPVPLGITDGRLLGGLDLSATLRAGRPIAERGVLAEADGGVVLLAMAERVDAGTVARLGAAMDCGEILIERDGLALRTPSRFGVVAFDEGIAEDEQPHAGLLDRLAFHISLDAISDREAGGSGPQPEALEAARQLLQGVAIAEPILNAICATALALGVESLRPSLLAMRAARVIAALEGRCTVLAEDAAIAARLVLAPRATRLPMAEPLEDDQEQSAEPESAPESEREADGAQTDGDTSDSPAVESDQPAEDIVLAAAQAAIPAGLLATLRPMGAKRQKGKAPGKAGLARNAARRGRPVGVRKGDIGGGARLNLIETLRAAAPWQRLRRDVGSSDRIAVRREDFRVARLKQRSETTTIFVVDASGSSALHRLAEAKGAIELMLGECYVRRDKVALVTFRGRAADLLLPPTRSLVRAKRCLASLPGGGGTPLAAGIDAAAALAQGVQRQGATPVVVFLTDGQGNIGRDGKAGRVQAEADAHAAAQAMRAAALSTLLVDTSPRAQPAARRLAQQMGATYLPMPAADATTLWQSVRSVGLQSQQARGMVP